MMPAILDTLAQQLAAESHAARIEHGLLVVEVAVAALPEVAANLKSNLRFDLLLDITAIDWPARTIRSPPSMRNFMAPFSTVAICSCTWLCAGTTAPFRISSRAMVILAPWMTLRATRGFNCSVSSLFQS